MARSLFPNSVAIRPDGEPYAYATFTLELRTETAVRTQAAHPTRPLYRFVTGADGAFPSGLTIQTPESGAWRWRLQWPDGKYADALIEQGDGSAIEIDDWVALSEQAGSEAGTPAGEFLNRLYTAVAAADDGQYLETVGGDLALVDAPEGMPEPEAAGIYGREIGEWTALGSAALSDADDFDGAGAAAAVAADLTTHTSDASVHYADATTNGLFARLRSSGVGSWLAATAVGAALFAAVDAAAARGAIGAATSAGAGTSGELMISDASGNAVRAAGYVPGYWMQRTAVGAGETVTIPSGHQMIVYGDFTVTGDLVAIGDLVIL